MSAPSAEMLAAQLARCVDRFRDPSAVDAQKAEFRALMQLLRQQGLSLREEGTRLLMNGTPLQSEALGSLVHRLALHNIGEITIPREPPPAEVFHLLKALAAQAGADDIPTQLRAAGVTQIRVSFPLPPVAAGDSPAASASGDQGGLGTEGILRGEPMTDIPSPRQSVGGVPQVTHDPLPPPADTALPAQGLAQLPETVPGRSPATPPPAPTSPRPVPPPPPPAPVPAPNAGVEPKSADLPPSDALAELARDPQALHVGDLLATLGRQVEDAARANRVEQALGVLAAIVREESRVTDMSARRHYSIALRRMYTKSLLKSVSQLLGAPSHRDAAMAVLRRAGADAVEMLIDRLVSAQTIAERRTVFDALRHMSEGRSQLVGMLTHHQWFVVRNVAELVGEMGMEEAVPALAKQIGHEDERVRKAVALALAKIGSGSTTEPLRRALRDKSAEVRIQVALGVGGRRSSALAMPLVVALGEEKDDAVQRELILALGRIGTSDAVQALIKVVQPAGRLFGRKPTSLRAAGIEGLRLAATAAAVGTLEGLVDDADRQVSAAAREALQDLQARKPR